MSRSYKEVNLDPVSVFGLVRHTGEKRAAGYDHPMEALFLCGYQGHEDRKGKIESSRFVHFFSTLVACRATMTTPRE